MRPTLVENASSPAESGAVLADAGRAAPRGAFRPTRRKVLFAWLVALAWAYVVWQFGGDDYAFNRTSAFLQPLIDWLLAGLDLATRIQLHAYTRKSAHFIEYAILALLSFRAAMLSAERHRIGTACWVSIFFVATLAAADEIRQSYSAVRTGSPYDVLIDVAGGAVGLLGVLLITRRMRNAGLLGDIA
jgi:VanZ family protein